MKSELRVIAQSVVEAILHCPEARIRHMLVCRGIAQNEPCFVKFELRHDNHKFGMNFWHLEFATKYRYKVFGKFKQKNIVEAFNT